MLRITHVVETETLAPHCHSVDVAVFALEFVERNHVEPHIDASVPMMTR